MDIVQSPLCSMKLRMFDTNYLQLAAAVSVVFRERDFSHSLCAAELKS